MSFIERWSKSNHPFKRVLAREIDRMVSRRFYFGACIVLPLFSLFFMSTIFNDGQMNNMPVGIVDMDQTAMSREISRSAAAVPQLNVTKYYVSEVEARTDVQNKLIYGYLVIPPDFESDAIAGRTTTLCYYYHYALLAVGGEVESGFETVLRHLSVEPVMLQAAVLGIQEERTANFLQPINSTVHSLFNPNLNYAIYLSNPFFFILFQVIILLTTTYAVGSEIKYQTAGEWIKAADMNIVTAVLAKLLPYTIIFSLIGICGNMVQFTYELIPYHCNLLILNLTTVLFVIATQAFALFIFSIFPVLSIIISIVSMLGSLGATLSGVTFPVTSMFLPVHIASYFLPVRHFTEICQSFLYGNAGFAYIWWNYAMLFVFIIPALIMLPRLKKALIKEVYWNNLVS